jgi:hypothetical protein
MALFWLWLVAMKFLSSLRRPASQRSSPTITVEAEMAVAALDPYGLSSGTLRLDVLGR